MFKTTSRGRPNLKGNETITKQSHFEILDFLFENNLITKEEHRIGFVFRHYYHLAYGLAKPTESYLIEREFKNKPNLLSIQESKLIVWQQISNQLTKARLLDFMIKLVVYSPDNVTQLKLDSLEKHLHRYQCEIKQGFILICKVIKREFDSKEKARETA